jgi:hypothetical protein
MVSDRVGLKSAFSCTRKEWLSSTPRHRMAYP